MILSRRTALSLLGGAAAAPLTAAHRADARQPNLIRPPRIRPGDVFGLVSPATAAFETDPTEVFADAFRAVGLEPRLGPNYYRRRGYFAGSDAERAADIMEFFADPEVKGIFARGGWGSARVLPHLDYDVIGRIRRCSSATATLPRSSWASTRRPAWS